MSTSYGTATVVFPGFPAITMKTVNAQILFPFWGGYKISSFLPKRTVKLVDGTKRRLSKKERSQLRTLSQKWSSKRGRKRPFRTLHEEDYC